ncbi:MAG TPA: cyclodeaminase/cyclohydrolase family protein [Xanthobacteraceae bacterium]|nr:cyclodeaminase/cyclohydrolase family protein [Xanthobacteraceae bacterium]
MIKQSSIEGFLDELASRSPTPGGGSAAAMMGAIGAALLSMVCNLTIGKAKYRDVEEELSVVLARTEQLRTQLTEMIEEDIEAFGAVMRAYAMPRQTPEQSVLRSQAIQNALKAATQVPLRCCRVCREIIDLSAVVAQKGNSQVVSDAGVAVLVAHAALRSGALNVMINIKAMTDRPFVAKQLTELDELLSQASVATEACYQSVRQSIS